MFIICWNGDGVATDWLLIKVIGTEAVIPKGTVDGSASTFLVFRLPTNTMSKIVVIDTEIIVKRCNLNLMA